MREKLNFIEILCEDLLKNAKIHMKNEEENNNSSYFYSKNWRSKDHGKTALKRKITYLRQELLNLEKMLD